ncbi:MAG: hypothetical protein ACRBBQ_09315 [Cognatishimia sp.]
MHLVSGPKYRAALLSGLCVDGLEQRDFQTYRFSLEFCTSHAPEQVQWLKSNAQLSRKETHISFTANFPNANISLAQIVGFKKRHSITTGRTGHFRKGQHSWNKGKKMPFNPNSAATQFKAGHLPHNHKGAGHEKICPKDGYVYLIIAEKNPHTGGDTRRVLKHKWLR